MFLDAGKRADNDEVIGIGIFNFKKHTQELQELKVNLPVAINFSALNV